jgi:hypothetical protein
METLKVGDDMSVDGGKPFYRVIARDGDWCRIQRVDKGILNGPVLRRKVRHTKSGERLMLPHNTLDWVTGVLG